MHSSAPDNKIRLPLFLRGGGSLAEIVIVLGIIFIALISLMASLAFAHQNNKTARESTELALIMQTCSSLIPSVKPATLKSNLAGAPISLSLPNRLHASLSSITSRPSTTAAAIHPAA